MITSSNFDFVAYVKNLERLVDCDVTYCILKYTKSLSSYFVDVKRKSRNKNLRPKHTESVTGRGVGEVEGCAE